MINKQKEPWDVWEKLLREEGFAFEQDKDVYINYAYKMAWGKKDILDEFENTADFREWLQVYKSDPNRQKEAEEFVRKMVAGITGNRKPVSSRE